MKITIDTDNLEKIGENLKATSQDGYLVITCELSKEIGLSSTGKMVGIASSSGFTRLPENLMGNIYIGKKK